MTNISFHRKFTAYTGGHQKVLDYLQHTLAYEGVKCHLYLQNESREDCIFSKLDKVDYQSNYDPSMAELVFLAGLDWRAYLPYLNEAQTKINLIQHLRHADPTSEQFYFLQHKAIRICVSEAVRDAIAPFANGPCIYVPMGHTFPSIQKKQFCDLYVLAKKRPGIGRRIKAWGESKGLSVILHDELQPKQNVFEAMSGAKLTVLLPNKTEGFYLPGIEAAFYSEKVLMTDCIANREYANISSNLRLCDFSLDSIIAALEEFCFSSELYSNFLEKTNVIRQKYSLEDERKQFHSLLSSLGI